MNEKDLHEIGEAIYWLAAVRADIEAMESSEARTMMLANMDKADFHVERVATGANRK